MRFGVLPHLLAALVLGATLALPSAHAGAHPLHGLGAHAGADAPRLDQAELPFDVPLFPDRVAATIGSAGACRSSATHPFPAVGGILFTAHLPVRAAPRWRSPSVPGAVAAVCGHDAAPPTAPPAVRV